MTQVIENLGIEERVAQFRPYVDSITLKARQAFRQMRQLDGASRNHILIELAAQLESSNCQHSIILANQKDIELAQKNNMSSAMIDRLKLDSKRILSIAQAVREIAAFDDPIGEVIRGQYLPNGVQMVQKRVPLGVVFTVYESRPNVTIDVAALCIKSGNAAILRGGKEAFFSNMSLYQVFVSVLASVGIDSSAVQLVEETDRACMLALLERDDRIDLAVPRGGEGLIKFVSQNTRIPVVKHDKGVCNLFIDESADLDKSIKIAINAKLQRPSVCNSIENLLIHSKFTQSKELLQALDTAGAELIGCNRSLQLYPNMRLITDDDTEYGTEYLDNRLAVKIVESLDEAVDFIYRYGSGHSEAIVTEKLVSAQQFENRIDSATVFVNCSTRFHDGGQMGMGAEVGISTGRLHVRGPMGVRDLTTTTYVMTGNGQVRS
ncbi:MAG: glutamate-5-semialdehyde dehydrogenase [Leptonema sp. (in: Bacteria)]|nr:glutamate-5-semialdehyde dehydrogenase [Leptonema sp. (in: bacteria)]